MTGVRYFSGFDELPQASRSLFEKAGNHCFFFGLPWFRVFVNHALDEGDVVRIYCSRSPEDSGDAALATVERAADSGVFKPRTLSSLSNYYTSLFGPVWNGTSDREAAHALATAIAGDSP